MRKKWLKGQEGVITHVANNSKRMSIGIIGEQFAQEGMKVGTTLDDRDITCVRDVILDYLRKRYITRFSFISYEKEGFNNLWANVSTLEGLGYIVYRSDDEDERHLMQKVYKNSDIVFVIRENNDPFLTGPIDKFVEEKERKRFQSFRTPIVSLTVIREGDVTTVVSDISPEEVRENVEEMIDEDAVEEIEVYPVRI